MAQETGRQLTLRLRRYVRPSLLRIDEVVGVVGPGYVGLPLCAAFVEARFRVLGFDVDPSRIEALGAGTNYLKHLARR